MFYELMKIVNPELREDAVEKVITRFTNNVRKNDGEVIRIEDMGIKTMAYKIEKKSKGHYFLSYLEGPGKMLSEIERTLRIDENVLRFIIIKLGEHVKREDLEKAVVAPAPVAEAEESQEAVEEDTKAADDSEPEALDSEEEV
ncbi:MAG TPA: 30S ribosomal protein S6 [Desulfomonilia bacterium]